MLKVIGILSLYVGFFHTIQANCPVTCRSNVASPVRCIRDVGGVFCAHMRECQVQEANCRLIRANQPPIVYTDEIMCRDLKEMLGFCALAIRKRRSVTSNCRNLKCSILSKTLNCYSSKDSKCQLLTNCQIKRINCERGRANRLKLDDMRRCEDMSAGQALRKCKNIPRRG
uniref:GDNF/GAS1 domain-containing protein n=1 Tax=Stomoxys calcitrans TaxID=35570 RepID=A0A1I8PQX8_STOCA